MLPSRTDEFSSLSYSLLCISQVPTCWNFLHEELASLPSWAAILGQPHLPPIVWLNVSGHMAGNFAFVITDKLAPKGPLTASHRHLMASPLAHSFLCYPWIISVQWAPGIHLMKLLNRLEIIYARGMAREALVLLLKCNIQRLFSL